MKKYRQLERVSIRLSKQVSELKNELSEANSELHAANIKNDYLRDYFFKSIKDLSLQINALDSTKKVSQHTDSMHKILSRTQRDLGLVERDTFSIRGLLRQNDSPKTGALGNDAIRYFRDPRRNILGNIITKGTINYFSPAYLFPMPPPRPSDQLLLPDSITAGKTSTTIINMVSQTLTQSGIGHNYFLLEGTKGYAIATHLQEYDETSCFTTKEVVARQPKGLWNMARNYFSRLLTERKGYYRMFVFVVTDSAINASGNQMNFEAAAEKKTHGLMALSAGMKRSNDVKNSYCYCFLYDFIKTENNNNPPCVVTPQFTIQRHLDAIRFQSNLIQYHATHR